MVVADFPALGNRADGVFERGEDTAEGPCEGRLSGHTLFVLERMPVSDERDSALYPIEHFSAGRRVQKPLDQRLHAKVNLLLVAVFALPRAVVPVRIRRGSQRRNVTRLR